MTSPDTRRVSPTDLPRRCRVRPATRTSLVLRCGRSQLTSGELLGRQTPRSRDDALGQPTPSSLIILVACASTARRDCPHLWLYPPSLAAAILQQAPCAGHGPVPRRAVDEALRRQAAQVHFGQCRARHRAWVGDSAASPAPRAETQVRRPARLVGRCRLLARSRRCPRSTVTARCR